MRNIRTFNASPMTIQELQLAVPSAFARQPHDSRTRKYGFVPTFEIINGLMQAGFQPFKAEQSRTRIVGMKEYVKHMIQFRHADWAPVNAVDDTVPTVTLVNSHNGACVYTLLASLLKLACLNGLLISDEVFGELKVRHNGDITRQVLEGSTRILEASQRSLDIVRQWSALQLTDGEQLAYAEAARTLRFADAEGKIVTPITAEQLLAPRRAEDANRSDLYNTMNRVQEHLIRGGDHGTVLNDGRRRNITTRAVNGITESVKLNQSLWVLSQRMAELKGEQEVKALAANA